jgi:hypothetical protein
MRFSEAMELGRLLLRPMAGHLISPDGLYGCAMGMAGLAVGLRLYLPPCKILGVDLKAEENYEVVAQVWPWINRKFVALIMPCGCVASITHTLIEDYGDVITHIFDEHVKGNSPRLWTMDMLITWVRSVEPEEESQRSQPAPSVMSDQSVVHNG